MKPLTIQLLGFMMFSFSFVFGQIKTTEFFFNTNDTTLTEYSQQKLDGFIQTAKETPFYLIKLRVFSDTVGPTDYNRQLSERRATAIRRQLGEMADKSYTEIGIYGKNYDSIKYPLGNLQMWRRLEIFYQYDEPELLQVNSSEQNRKDGDSSFVETPIEVFQTDYQSKKEVFIFDTLTTERVGETIALDIRFVQNSDVLYGNSYSEVKSLSDFLKRNEALHIVIRGHVCCGPNKRISKKRAKRVYLLLKESGIQTKRMSWKGMSNTEPLIFPEQTENDRKANRRVDVRFFKN